MIGAMNSAITSTGRNSINISQEGDFSSGVLFKIQIFWNRNSVSANLILLLIKDKILFKGR
jgi:hypothetical protein